MNEKITALIKLQEHDTRLETLQHAKDRLGPDRERVKAEIQGLVTRAEDNKKALQQAQVDKKSLELDVDAKEQAMRKSSGELNSVKSNEAYKALLSQIEEAKKSKSAIEDQLLELMEKIDALQKDAKEQEKALQGEKAALEKKISEIDAEEQRMQGDYDAKKKERDDYFATLPADVQTPYENLSRSKKRGATVVAIIGGICGGCKTTLPPTVVNEVMKGKDLISCDTCSRILYLPSAPVAS